HRLLRHGTGHDPSRHRAWRPVPRFRRQDHPETTALPARMPARSRTGRLRLQRLFLPLPRYRNGSPRLQGGVSTIDSAFLFAGALTVGAYFDRDTPDEVEIRSLADALYRRADWNWARDGGPTLTHGWRPENGFIPHRYEGYDEGLLLYILGLGSPTHP